MDPDPSAWVDRPGRQEKWDRGSSQDDELARPVRSQDELARPVRRPKQDYPSRSDGDWPTSPAADRRQGTTGFPIRTYEVT